MRNEYHNNLHKKLSAMDEMNRPENLETGDEWLTSYSDLMTLLMTFFVLLASISSIDASKFEQVANSMSNAVGDVDTPQKSLEEVYKDVNTMLTEENLSAEVKAEKTPQGVAISVPGAYLFQSGSADISPQAQPLIKRIAEIIRSVPYNVAIEGHTDDVPIQTREFPSNWELSAARASGIVRFLIDQGIYSRRLRAVGFSDTQPIVPNIDPMTGVISPENRARNRRVVIRFLAF
ncbi:MAG: OmpA family protein [Calditrichaeota bacterium]|nr:OmpA family protein [Calditrichota bacterium]MCB0266911.1 OmpA family protein [Calditrichota bacterium]MCB0301400.1 OmpA family protein [Calditrichota bacterium]MCB9066844.1 OmpA family protein [Calditrichia bacterium]